MRKMKRRYNSLFHSTPLLPPFFIAPTQKRKNLSSRTTRRTFNDTVEPFFCRICSATEKTGPQRRLFNLKSRILNICQNINKTGGTNSTSRLLTTMWVATKRISPEKKGKEGSWTIYYNRQRFITTAGDFYSQTLHKFDV